MEGDAIVIDNGSGCLKIGWSGDVSPRDIFTSVVGRPKEHRLRGPLSTPSDSYVGDRAQALRGILRLSYPIHRGTVTNWDDMERLWHHALYRSLYAAPQEHPLLISEPPLAPKAHKEKTQQLMFETFNVPAFHAALGGILGAYCAGRRSALVVDIGEGTCALMSISGGHSPGASRWDFGGWDLTRHLAGLLRTRGHDFGSSAELEVVREVKEKECYVSEDFQGDLRSPRLKTYKLPDGHSLRLGPELFCGPEALFRPGLVGMEGPGVAERAFGALLGADMDYRRVAVENIVLCGGTTCLRGFPERLKREMERLVPASWGVKIRGLEQRKNAVWIGGSILACSPAFQQMWLSKEEYDESGPTIFTRKIW